MRAALLLVLAATAGAGTAQPASFDFQPKPRWVEAPETEIVCAAIAAECPGRMKDAEISAEWGYAELYDANGKLAGLRTLQSTGCKPLDEHMLLGHRSFRAAFSKPGEPDLPDITVELAPGTPRDAVRLVRRGSTQVSLGC